MSKLRPECRTASPDAPCPRGVTAYLSVYNSVRGESGLIHGRLHDGRGAHCAIGSFFHSVDRGTALPEDLIDEVATVNDSCRNFTPKQRRNSVLKWLRWKLEQLGYHMSGPKAAKAK
jgi:hypothetical protein